MKKKMHFKLRFPIFVKAIFALWLAQCPAAANDLPHCTKLTDTAGDALSPVQPLIVHSPDNADVNSAEVGQSLLSSVQASVYPESINLLQAVSYSGSGPTSGYTISIPPGNLQVMTNNPAVAVYISTSASIVLNGKVVEDRAGIAIKSDPNAPPRIWWDHPFASFFRGVGTDSFADNVPDAKVIVNNCIGPSTDSLKREIIYSGVSKGTITLMYREFTNDFARPAFSQQLTYDLKDGAEVGYKGARLKIIKATNTDITYKVTKPLD